MNRAIDHLVLCVRDLEAARATYRRLGFTLTPPARHPWGTGNSLVQLQGNFLELLSIAEPEKIEPPSPGQFSFGSFSRSFLEKREGMAMLVFATSDARADQAEFAARGLRTYAPFDFSRRARLPDGSEVTVAFSLAFATDPRMPEAAFFTCQQHAPQYFWKPEYQRQANGARRVVEVVMAAPDPAGLADFFGMLVEPSAITRQEGQLSVALEGGTLLILDPPRLAARFPRLPLAHLPQTPCFVGYSIGVADLPGVAATLQQNNVAFVTTAGRLRIDAERAFGVVIEFVAGR
jgi:catechol 2,3-dioxygenase-like lactoylglutathione lyase family enzyme